MSRNKKVQLEPADDFSKRFLKKTMSFGWVETINKHFIGVDVCLGLKKN